jgi:hypothetical protein
MRRRLPFKYPFQLFAFNGNTGGRCFAQEISSPFGANTLTLESVESVESVD